MSSSYINSVAVNVVQNTLRESNNRQHTNLAGDCLVRLAYPPFVKPWLPLVLPWFVLFCFSLHTQSTQRDKAAQYCASLDSALFEVDNTYDYEAIAAQMATYGMADLDYWLKVNSLKLLIFPTMSCWWYQKDDECAVLSVNEDANNPADWFQTVKCDSFHPFLCRRGGRRGWLCYELLNWRVEFRCRQLSYRDFGLRESALHIGWVWVVWSDNTGCTFCRFKDTASEFETSKSFRICSQRLRDRRLPEFGGDGKNNAKTNLF